VPGHLEKCPDRLWDGSSGITIALIVVPDEAIQDSQPIPNLQQYGEGKLQKVQKIM